MPGVLDIDRGQWPTQHRPRIIRTRRAILPASSVIGTHTPTIRTAKITR